MTKRRYQPPPRFASPLPMGRRLDTLLDEATRANLRKRGFAHQELLTKWQEIVGQEFAAVTLPETLAFDRGKRAAGRLHLLVEPASALIVQHEIERIRERINRFFGYGAIAQIRILQTPLPQQTAKPLPRRAPEVSQDDVDRMAKELGLFESDRLRNACARLGALIELSPQRRDS
ncbi:MAG: DciA family protein [Pseudomonadota bacterium]